MSDSSSGFAAEVRELIAGGDHQLAFDRLKAACHGVSPRLYDDVILLESRLNRVLRDSRRGTLPGDEKEARLNQISAAALDLLADVVRALAGPPPKKGSANAAPPPPPAAPGPEIVVQEIAYQQILGINNLKQISWIEEGIRCAGAVCRVLTPGGSGTGFHVGKGILMTNNHVLPSAAVAAASHAEFNYQQSNAGGFASAVRYSLSATDFHTDVALDYSFARIVPAQGKAAPESWGALRLNADADPIPQEHVTIVQHPNGGYKQIAMTANWVVTVQPPMLHYTTDTMPGSSGSPVFNDSWHVIAIHHGSGHIHRDARGSVRYLNEGVLMSAIRANAGDRWPR